MVLLQWAGAIARLKRSIAAFGKVLRLQPFLPVLLCPDHRNNAQMPEAHSFQRLAYSGG